MTARRTLKVDLSPTLTPHQDAYRAGLADLKADMEPKAALAGPEGVHARIWLRFMEAYGLTFSHEMDLGTVPEVIIGQFACVLGDVVASLLSTFVLPMDETDADKEKILTSLIAELAHRIINQALKSARETLRGDGEALTLDYDTGQAAGNA